ncbi:11092_t:CDS:2, partial [Scutellospora calospora]
MSESKFTYMEECNTSKESYKEDTFIINQILEGTQIILSDNDEMDIPKESYEVNLESAQIMLNDSNKMDTLEENYEDVFTVNQVTLENAQIMLNYDDEMEDFNWDENENSSIYSERDIQVACIGVHKYPAFTKGSFSQKLHSDCIRYICSECFQQHDEHLYKRPGKQKAAMVFMSCTELKKHHNDTSDTLKLIKKWLISVAKLDNRELQQRLLSKIFSSIINNTMTNLLEILSKLVVEIAIRIKNIKLNNLTKEKLCITPVKASIMGERLGREVLRSYSEIKDNIDHLENPSSYENYFDALPNVICCFFQELLM